jgi:hypothetical protein
VKLQATLAGDAGTKVAYRWQAATRRAFSVETVTLTAKPRVIMDVRTSSAAPYRLVVDEPVHRQTTPVACHAASGAG